MWKYNTNRFNYNELNDKDKELTDLSNSLLGKETDVCATHLPLCRMMGRIMRMKTNTLDTLLVISYRDSHARNSD